MCLKNSTNDACRCAHCRVQHVHKLDVGVHLLRLAVAHQEATRLIVKTVAAGDELTEGTGTGEPGLQIQLLGGGVIQSAGHNVHNAVGNAKQLAELLGVANHLVHELPGFAVMRRGEHKLFHFLELMDTENAASVTTV